MDQHNGDPDGEEAGDEDPDPSTEAKRRREAERIAREERSGGDLERFEDREDEAIENENPDFTENEQRRRN